MSKKLYALIVGLVGVACTATSLVVEYFAPEYSTQVNTVCNLVQPFVADILVIFVVTEVAKVAKKK